MADSPLNVWSEQEGRLLRLRLASPKANLIDARMIAALQQAFDKAIDDPLARGVLIDAQGDHFSFGASVEEHLPKQCGEMLSKLHHLLITMVGFNRPIMVAVRGQCLGGGLEFACAGSRLFARDDSRFGQPEIQLAVFAPAASCLLPDLVGPANAEDLLLTGRTISGERAHEIGLVAELADDPEESALNYFEKYLSGLSASSLGIAVQAARIERLPRLRKNLDAVEKLYLEELMATEDAVEGLTAFLEKRRPKWSDN